ncbi:MAG: hypothetical protein V4662_02260 [Verrucomicrobiota bacterium]
MQVSWIDETDMTALLGRLRDPQPSTKMEQDLGDAGTLFEEPVIRHAFEPAPIQEEPVVDPAPAHADLDDFRSRLQAIRERAMGAGLLPQPVVLPEVEETDEPEFEDEHADLQLPFEEKACPASPPQSVTWSIFEPRGNSVMERLESFATWAGPHLQKCEFFVIDDQGDMLWGSSAHQELVLTMVMAWVASSRMSAVFAFNHSPLLRRAMASGGHLIAIPCPTRLGLLHLAITSEQPLSDEHLPELRYALIAAMEAVG